MVSQYRFHCTPFYDHMGVVSPNNFHCTPFYSHMGVVSPNNVHCTPFYGHMGVLSPNNFHCTPFYRHMGVVSQDMFHCTTHILLTDHGWSHNMTFILHHTRFIMTDTTDHVTRYPFITTWSIQSGPRFKNIDRKRYYLLFINRSWVFSQDRFSPHTHVSL